MRITYYQKYDPRRLSEPIQKDDELTNLLSTSGEPVTIIFKNNTFQQRLVIKRDVTIIGNLRAKLLLTGSAKVTFSNATITPPNIKGDTDTKATVLLAGNFTGTLTVQNSTLNALPSSIALSVMSDTKPVTSVFDNATIEGITLLCDVATLSNRVTIKEPKQSQVASVLNSAYYVTNDTTLELYHARVMNAQGLCTLTKLVSKAGPNELNGTFDIRTCVIEGSNKALEQLKIKSDVYDSDVVFHDIFIEKSVKHTAAIFVDKATIVLKDTSIQSKSPTTRVVLCDSTVELIKSVDQLAWNLSGDSHINTDSESVSSLLQLLDKFPPTKRHTAFASSDPESHNETTTQVTDDEKPASELIKTSSDLDLPTDDTLPDDIKPTEKTAEEELNDLIGLDSVKTKLNQFIANATMDAERKKRGITSRSGLNRNMIFLGNPGTGKTTVARLVARILHEHGALQTDKVVEVSRNGLISENVGGTAIKTASAIESAKGGILFVDEAYCLNEAKATGSYVSEAVEVLMKYAEDERDSTMFILAGYTDQMYDLLETGNPGFKSRFPASNHIEFEDYTLEDKVEIFTRMMESSGAIFDKAYLTAPKFTSLMNFYSRDNSNARSVRNLVEALLLARDQRLNTVEDIRSLTNERMVTVDAKDIIAVYNKAIETKRLEDESRRQAEMFQQQFTDVSYENDIAQRIEEYEKLANAFDE